MKLEKLEIKGFRKCNEIEILFGDATFLIGENNVGKSSILRAIELLITANVPKPEDYSKKVKEETNEVEDVSSEIILTGTFTSVSEDADNWIGFKGRVFVEEGQRKIKYRKTFSKNDKPVYEIWEQKKELKSEVLDGAKITLESIISSGIDESIVEEHFTNISRSQNLKTKAYKTLLESFNPIWNYEDTFNWVNNPGGIPQIVISKLPKYVLIPAEHKANEIDSDKKTALGEVMSTIFSDVVESSNNFEKVKEYFGELEKEIDTENESTTFGKLMINVNSTIRTIFPDSEIQAKVNLSDPNSFLKPKYDIKLGSNILTDVSYQGTGMVRSTAFSLLKFREDWKKEREGDLRNLVICFEEPELFLHPNASNQMRNAIYDLAGGENQIICTSHSPYMIDLSRDNEKQIINNITVNDDTFVKSNPFSVTEKFKDLMDDDRHYIKMLVKIDDYFARAFFAKKIVIIEGDTEDVVLKKSISILDKEVQNRINADFQFIKARGKATIPPLVKYFEALSINDYFVIHDRDRGTERAEQVNPRILSVINAEDKRIMLEECIEDCLGYDAPSKDKPYKAYIEVKDWNNIQDIPDSWKNVLEKVFRGYIN
ncbi:MAG: AAA family ATPase [Flavobacteriaceae bacterium]|nr:AAA family ATPase [Flavobacteriaceae bacterium]